jgi:ubiquinone/menaquinone biosynthesis C-methylase UbiE
LTAIRFQCPGCRAAETDLDVLAVQPWTCPSCGQSVRRRDNIIRGLTHESEERYSQFFEQYIAIRRAEGRGGEDPAYYLELPFRRGIRPTDWQWPMRAATYRFFERRVLVELEESAGRPLRILDLGAGVGWLSYRLALRGHEPVAVDLLDDPLDGLGAARHYDQALENPFPLIQAEFDRIPLADEQFDLAIFNASFHYAADYRSTLREVRRLLGWGGRVVILDTPVYQSYLHGEQMREERQEQFEKRYGFRSDSLLSIEYLDEKMIQDLGRELNIRWRALEPWYGLAWRLRPLRAKLARRRPPSRFKVLVGSWAGA